MKLVDLTQTIHQEMQVFPTDPKPIFLRWSKRESHGFESEVLYMSSHTGTHMDAPYHFHPDGRTVDKLRLDLFLCDGVLLDLTAKGARDHIDLNDLERGLKNVRSNIRGKAVILHTAWSKRFGQESYLSENPGLTKEAARFLTSKQVALVGIDTANVDHPSDPTFPAHNIFLPNEIPIVENLCRLDEIKARRFRFIALPLKLKGGTGSPVRAIAEVA